MPFDPNNAGSLSRNHSNNPKAPSHKGSAVIAGREYWISAWVREAKSGRNAGSKFFSLRFEPKEKPQTPDPAPESAPEQPFTVDDNPPTTARQPDIEDQTPDF